MLAYKYCIHDSHNAYVCLSHFTISRKVFTVHLYVFLLENSLLQHKFVYMFIAESWSMYMRHKYSENDNKNIVYNLTKMK